MFKQNSRNSSFEGYDLSKTRLSGGDRFRFLIASASGQSLEIDGATVLTAGLWYHVAAVRGSNFTQIYVNGQLDAQGSVSFAQDYGTLPLYFGTSGQTFWDHKLNGYLDEVALYNRALPVMERSAEYAAGSAVGAMEQPSSANLKARARWQAQMSSRSRHRIRTREPQLPVAFQCGEHQRRDNFRAGPRQRPIHQRRKLHSGRHRLARLDHQFRSSC